MVLRQDASVNCGPCSACCRRELVALVNGDNPANYEHATEAPPELAAAMRDLIPESLGWTIPHGPDGACVYLKDGKCSVYEKRPKMCRIFSCVGWVAKIKATTSRAEIKRDMRAGFIDREIWNAGLERTPS